MHYTWSRHSSTDALTSWPSIESSCEPCLSMVRRDSVPERHPLPATHLWQYVVASKDARNQVAQSCCRRMCPVEAKRSLTNKYWYFATFSIRLDLLGPLAYAGVSQRTFVSVPGAIYCWPNLVATSDTTPVFAHRSSNCFTAVLKEAILASIVLLVKYTINFTGCIVTITLNYGAFNKTCAPCLRTHTKKQSIRCENV